MADLAPIADRYPVIPIKWPKINGFHWGEMTPYRNQKITPIYNDQLGAHLGWVGTSFQQIGPIRGKESKKNPPKKKGD